jgi:hypothetical protein
MRTDVLILAARYDATTSHTFRWAQDLHSKMFRYADTCVFLDVTGLCRGGSSLADLIGAATHVVFYGHGEKDQWIALPGASPIALVETNTIKVLDQRKVYAGCCWSLTGMGQAFANNCGGEYLGYDNQFGFDPDNEDEFRDVVNQSVINFVVSGNAAQVVSDLLQQWTRLSNDFTHGHLISRPNAVLAGKLADQNSQRIGKKP